jgi:hypothetical protein
MSAERRSRTVTAYRYAFTLSRSSSVATRIGSTILSFGRPAFALTAIKVGAGRVSATSSCSWALGIPMKAREWYEQFKAGKKPPADK